VANWTLEELKNNLLKPLPGKTAQHKMAPGYRPDFTDEEIRTYNPRISAVMILFYQKNNDWHLVFTERKKYEGVHSGQMSFPGGKQEPNEDLPITALRETREEVGVEAHDIEIINQLSTLYIPPSNFLVHPFIGIATTDLMFKKQESEVENVVEIPVSFFLDERSKTKTEIVFSAQSKIEVPAFIYEEKIIWGATAIILSELVELLGSTNSNSVQ